MRKLTICCSTSENQPIFCVHVSHSEYLTTKTTSIFRWLVPNGIYSIGIGGGRPRWSKIIERPRSNEVDKGNWKVAPFPALYYAEMVSTGLFTASTIILRLSNSKKQTISFLFTIYGLHAQRKSAGSRWYYNATSTFAYQQLEYNLYFTNSFL